MSDGLPHLRYGGLLAHGWVPFPFITTSIRGSPAIRNIPIIKPHDSFRMPPLNGIHRLAFQSALA
jgi:hypothetical protein